MKNYPVAFFNEYEAFIKNYLNSHEVEKNKVFGNPIYSWYRISAPFKKGFEIVIKGYIFNEVVINEYKDKTANFVFIQDKNNKIVSRWVPIEINSLNWKSNLVKAVEELKAESKDETKVKSDKEIKKKIDEIKSIPMYSFNNFLMSVANAVIAYGSLTDAQERAVQKIKESYTPKIPLSPRQVEVLKKMDSIPASSVSPSEKLLIPKLYAKACAGEAWTDEERTKMSAIMKKHNLL